MLCFTYKIGEIMKSKVMLFVFIASVGVNFGSQGLGGKRGSTANAQKATAAPAYRAGRQPQ